MDTETETGIRTLLLTSYDIPKYFYQVGFPKASNPRKTKSPVFWMKELGVLIWYGSKHPHTGSKRRPRMDVDDLVKKWKVAVVGLAVAHDKDSADRFEATIGDILTPILTAPVTQIREFGPKLLEALRSDEQVPYLVWRAYEVWVEMMKGAPDEGIKELKRDLAAQIVEIVEKDVKSQLPEAMIRALMWRSPEKLAEVKKVVEEEVGAGRKVRLKGRESCLFLEAGGTEDEPKVCVQI